MAKKKSSAPTVTDAIEAVPPAPVAPHIDWTSAKMVPVTTPRPAPVNPNVMSPGQYRDLKEGIALHGMVQPILLLPDDEIVDGHHRLRAAVDLGHKSAPCVVIHDMTHEQAAAFRIALSHNRGSLDLTATSSTLRELAAKGWDTTKLTYTGLSEDELRSLSAPLPDVDAANLETAAGAGGEETADMLGAGTSVDRVPKLTIDMPSKGARDRVKSKLLEYAGSSGDLGTALCIVLDIEP